MIKVKLKSIISIHRRLMIGGLGLALLLLFSSFQFVPNTATSDSSGLQPADTTVSDSVAADTTSQDSAFRELDRVIPNNAFHVGEKLDFQVRYGFIKAGEATMEVAGTTQVAGDREAYKIISTARSTGTFDFFFKVRDRVETYLDTRGIFSWKFNKFLREGSYKFDLVADYNQYLGDAFIQTIRYEDEDKLKVKEKKNFNIQIPPYVVDILGAFYYVRTQKLELGMPLYMETQDNKKVYNLKVLVQKREVVDVKAGKFRCIVVQPQLRGDAIFKQKGKLWVWLTDDEYKIPVQMKSAVFVGSITTELTDIRGIKLPIPSQISD